MSVGCRISHLQSNQSDNANVLLRSKKLNREWLVYPLTTPGTKFGTHVYFVNPKVEVAKQQNLPTGDDLWGNSLKNGFYATKAVLIHRSDFD